MSEKNNRVAALLGVSLGPGDPGLITRAAWEALHTPGARWAYPVRGAAHESYALEIVQRAGVVVPENALRLVFPMTRDGTALARAWAQAAQAVCAVLEAGQDVHFLVEGDASTYATFRHLARTVRALRPETPVRTIAGVNAFAAAAAITDRPLAEEGDTLAVIPAAYGIEALDPLLAHFDSLVLMKVKPLLPEIIDWLERRGLLAHSVFIEKAGSPDERVVTDLASLRGAKVNYLSLILVHQPNRTRPEMARGCRPKPRPASDGNGTAAG